MAESRNTSSGDGVVIDPKFFRIIGDPLGSGAFGTVFLCQYDGSHPDVLKLCDINKMVAVKYFTSGNIDQAELANVKAIYERSISTFTAEMAPLFSLDSPRLRDNPEQQEQQLSALDEAVDKKIAEFRENVVVSLPMKSNRGDVVGVVSPLVAYAYTPQKTYSSDLQDYLIDVATSLPYLKKGSDELRNPTQKTLGEDVAISLAQLSSAMLKGQEQLHAIGMLHNDTAARNFLVSAIKRNGVGDIISFDVKLADPGLSGVMAENGLMPVDATRNVPIRYLNRSVIETRYYDIYSDIYSLKAALIENVGLLQRKMHPDVLCQQPGESANDFFNFRFQKTDNEALLHFLSNVQHGLSTLSPAVANQIATFINYYHDFMTTMPPANLSLKEVHAFTTNQLQQCNQRLWQHLLNAKISECQKHSLPPIDLIKDTLLTVQRLKTLEVSDAFKQSKDYKLAQRIQTSSDLLEELRIHAPSLPTPYRDSLKHYDAHAAPVDMEMQKRSLTAATKTLAQYLAEKKPDMVESRGEHIGFKQDVDVEKISSERFQKHVRAQQTHEAVAVRGPKSSDAPQTPKTGADLRKAYANRDTTGSRSALFGRSSKAIISPAAKRVPDSAAPKQEAEPAPQPKKSRGGIMGLLRSPSKYDVAQASSTSSEIKREQVNKKVGFTQEPTPDDSPKSRKK